MVYPEDTQPGYDQDQDENAPVSPTRTVFINRDTLVLVGSVALLVFSVLCTFLVPAFLTRREDIASQETPTSVPTHTTPEVGTSTATSASVFPSLTPDQVPTRITSYPEPGTPGVPTHAAGYLEPDQTLTPGGSVTPGSGVPTRSAGIPTSPSGGVPTRSSGISTPSTGGTSTAPSMPTRATGVYTDPTESETLIAGVPTSGTPEPVGSPPAQGTVLVPTPTPEPPTEEPTATSTPTDVPTPTEEPTFTPTPTPTPTEPVADTPLPLDTTTPDDGVVATEGPEFTPTPTPTEPPPYVVVSNDTRWVSEQGPIVLDKTVQIAPGASLVIDAGSEIRLGWGTSLVVERGATLHVRGTADNPVRFVSQDGRRWEGVFGHPDSTIVLDHADIRQGGAGGTVVMSEQGTLTIIGSVFEDNGGTIVSTDSRLEMRDSHVYGNDFPYGGAVNANYTRGNILTLINNRLGGNRMSDGAPVVNIHHMDVLDTLVMDIQSNMMYIPIPAGSPNGANLLISTNGPLEGTIACNSLVGSTDGLSLRSDTTQLPDFRLNVFDNLIDGHVAPINPYYIKHGIGRGATSEVELNMQYNWWGDTSGPYHPEDNPEGKGDSVGNNIIYRPWNQEQPACVPPPPSLH